MTAANGVAAAKRPPNGTGKPRGRPRHFAYPGAPEGPVGPEKPTGGASDTVEEIAADLASVIARLIKATGTPRAGVAPGAAGGLGGLVVSDRAPGEPKQLLVGVKVACEVLGIKPALLGAMMRRGEILSVKLGGRRLIPMSALEAFVAELEERARKDIERGWVPGL